MGNEFTLQDEIYTCFFFVKQITLATFIYVKCPKLFYYTCSKSNLHMCMDVNFLFSEGCGTVSSGFNHKSDTLQLPLLFSGDSHPGEKSSVQPSAPCNVFCGCRVILCLEDQDVSLRWVGRQPGCLFLCTTKWLLNFNTIYGAEITFVFTAWF